MTKMIDAHWANVPMTKIPLPALACTCVSLPLLATASWITVQAEDPGMGKNGVTGQFEG